MLCKFELKAIGGKNRPNVCRCWRLENRFLRVREGEREGERVSVRNWKREEEEKQWIISLNLRAYLRYKGVSYECWVIMVNCILI